MKQTGGPASRKHTDRVSSTTATTSYCTTRRLQNPAGLAPQRQQLRSAGSAHAPARDPGRPARMTRDTDGRDGPYGRRYFRGAGAPAWLQMVTGAHGGHGLPPICELFTHMPLKKMVVTHMPQKSSQTHVCHVPNFCLRVCHSIDILLEFNSDTRDPHM
jgi:hypothetical protein